MSEETSSRGCAALINLVISAVILLILIAVLLPGYFTLPDWFGDFIDLSSVEKPTAWGDINLYPKDGPKADYVYLLNTAPELKRITQNTKNEDQSQQVQSYKVLLSCKRIITNEFVWQQELGKIYPNVFPQVKLLYDDAKAYTLFKKEIKAFSLVSGEEQWHLELNESIPTDCASCIKLDAKQSFMLLKLNSGVVKGIDLNTGMQVWEQAFSAQHQADFQGLLQNTQNTAYLVSNLSSDNPETQLNYFNTLNAQTQLKLSFPFSIQYSLLKEENLYLLNQQNGRYFFELYQLTEGKKAWSQKLPPNIILNSSVNRENRFFEGKKAIYLISHNPSGRTHQVIELTYNQPKPRTLLQSSDYELKILSEGYDQLYVQAWHKSRNTQMELWSVSKEDGKINWTFDLNASINFLKVPQSLDLYLHQYHQKLYCFQSLSLPRRLQVTVLDLKTGKVLQEADYNVNDTPLSGVNSHRNQLFFTIGALYIFDLDELVLTKEWP